MPTEKLFPAMLAIIGVMSAQYLKAPLIRND